jgi:hypothetical protein
MKILFRRRDVPASSGRDDAEHAGVQVSPHQAQQITPATVKEAANGAQQQDPSIVEHWMTRGRGVIDETHFL